METQDPFWGRCAMREHVIWSSCWHGGHAGKECNLQDKNMWAISMITAKPFLSVTREDEVHQL